MSTSQAPDGFQPAGDRILIRPDKPAAEQKRGTLYLPSIAQEKPQRGEVVAVGGGRTSDAGVVIPCAFRLGQRVMFGKFSGTELKFDDEPYLLMRESDILGIVDA